MSLRNVLTVLGSAAVTAAVALALLAPRGSARADPTVQPVIAQAHLTSQACTFTLKTDKAKYEAGESPVVEVAATNPTDKPVTASVWVTVTERSPTTRMSRMLPMSLTLWSHEYAFTVPAHETKTLTAPCAAMPAGKSVTILLTDNKDLAVLMGDIGIPAQNTQNGGPNGGQQNAVPLPVPVPQQ
jgi:hypothetical protein